MRRSDIKSNKANSITNRLLKKSLALLVLLIVGWTIYPQEWTPKFKLLKKHLQGDCLVQNIEILNNKWVTDDSILSLIDLQLPASIATVDVHAIKTSLEKHPHIKSADVQFKVPAALRIHIVEKIPYALWWHERKFCLIDVDGAILKDNVQQDEYNELLVIAGDGANMMMQNVLQYLQITPLSLRIHSIQLIGKRRWDLLLKDGILVKLPEKGVKSAINSLEMLLMQEHLDKKPEMIDLRLLPEKIFIKFEK